MSRRKPTVVLPQPATSMLRRSTRLQNRENQAKDLVSNSEPPRRIRRRIGEEAPAKRLVYSSGGSSSKKSRKLNISVDGLRRSLRVSNANKEKCSSAKPVSFSSSRVKPTNVSSSCTLRRSPRFSSGGGGSVNLQSGNSVLSKCSTKSVEDSVRSRDRSRSRSRPKTKQLFSGSDDEEKEEQVSERKSTKKMRRDCDNDEEEVSEKKRRTETENDVPKADEGKRRVKEDEEGVKRKNKVVDGWTEEVELALQGAYLTVKPSPNFWKKVAKMVPGKSAQECFDRVNSDLITPRQLPPRSRARKSNLSPIPQFSLSASKLLKPNSPKTKVRHRKNNLSKKTIRHLLEKQSCMDQGVGFDLFSVFEPGTSSNLPSTPTEKGQRLPKILKTPVPCSRFASKDQTTLVSPAVLKPVKNKALHERYIDHLHVREAKRKAASTRLAGKENRRPIDIQKKDSVKAAKDALLFDVQDAIQKLKGLEAENSPSSSEFYYAHGETDEEDESV